MTTEASSPSRLSTRDCGGGKDVVNFHARTTGSLGQIYVCKSKKLVVTHLNRIKNDYQLRPA